MHLPDGRSLPLLAWRSSKSAFARGVQGTSTPSTAMLTSHFPLVVCQMPDKSGCPSGALGAGALRFGLPLGSRGMPGVGYPIHCPAAMPNAMSAISRIERGKHTAMSARKLGGMRAGNSAPREGTESAAGTGGRLPMKVDLSHRTATTLALLMLATTPLPTASAEDDGLGLAALFQQQVSRRLSVPPEEQTLYVGLLDAALQDAAIQHLPPQFIVLVDRSPRVQSAMIFWKSPDGLFEFVGATTVSTGAPGAFEHF